MLDLTDFDRQLGESVHMLVLMLRVGYPIRMACEHLAEKLPPPIAEMYRTIATSTFTEMDVIAELETYNQQVPSEHLREVIGAFWNHHYHGGALADWLEPVASRIVQLVGVDPEVQEQSYLLQETVQPA